LINTRDSGQIMALEKENATRASDRIAQELRKMIISLELQPGAKVSEADLVERLNCGRTPLREALQRLAEEYLVVSIPHHGVSIAELGLTDYVQLIEAVSHIEAISTRLASQRLGEEDIKKLKSIIEKAEEAHARDDILSIVEYDFNFHHTIALSTRNRYIIHMTDRLHRLTSRFIYLAWRNGGEIHPSIAEHKEILQALTERDAARAEKLTFEHTQNAKERIIQSL
jgi:DNA-binding GntR family transcriptional regulator